MWELLGKLKGWAFGSSGRGVIEQVSDTVDKWKPSPVTQHKMNIEDLKVGDESQAQARGLQFVAIGDGWFNVLVDGLNRLPRPLFALWAWGVLVGIVPSPTHLMILNPVVLNIVWTIIGFYFGIRTISQDLPKAVESFYKIRAMMGK